MRALDEGHSFVVTRGGRPVGELRPIAATALANGLPLVTRNGADFAGLDGLVEIFEV